MREVDDWSSITIGQYQEMMMIQTENNITRFIESVSIVLDCDPQTIRDMQMKDYKDLQSKMQFISKEPKSDIIRKFEIDGKWYGLIPDMDLMTAGVFLDAESFKEDAMKNLHYTVALIYRPIISEDGDDYTISEHKAEGFERRAELFKHNLSIEIVLGAVLFFSLLVMESSADLLTSLAENLTKDPTYQKMMKMTQTPTKKRKQKRSTDNGASMTSS